MLIFKEALVEQLLLFDKSKYPDIRKPDPPRKYRKKRQVPEWVINYMPKEDFFILLYYLEKESNLPPLPPKPQNRCSFCGKWLPDNSCLDPVSRETKIKRGRKYPEGRFICRDCIPIFIKNKEKIEVF